MDPTPPLSRSRYQRQLLVPSLGGLSGQTNLLSSRVLIIGLGGLGCPAALYLSGAGVGTLGLMDGDTVELSNLHRQIGHCEASALNHRSKVSSLLDRCRESNSEITYIPHEMHATASSGSGSDSLMKVLREYRYDVVLDCTDNPATRYLISDCCTVLGLVLVSGAAQRGEGQLVVLNDPPLKMEGGGVGGREREKGPCYRCVFPRPPPPEMVRGCGEIGILGHVVGTIGILMAGEVVKIISQGRHLPRRTETQTQTPTPTREDLDLTSTSTSTSIVNGVNPSLKLAINTTSKPSSPSQPHTMLLYNTFASDPRQQFRTITLRGRRKDCPACGDDEVLTSKGITRVTAETIEQGRLDYVAFCGGVEQEVRVLKDENRIDARMFLDLMSRETEKREEKEEEKEVLVIDVREKHEVELGAKLRGSVNLPMSKILRFDGEKVFEQFEREVIERRRMKGREMERKGKKSHDEIDIQDITTEEISGDYVDNDTNNPPGPALYFVCHRGNDSQIAADKFLQHVQSTRQQEPSSSNPDTDQPNLNQVDWSWIGDVKGGFTAMEKLEFNNDI
ncbi:hypothetical protein PV10_02773 [Exophiala mesophila]|uniref:Rhodanese domain-containing protein n=1 Tax=Exophiala mesophila TaxID=212818 RepID=A0A0D1ZMA2_EXOME|nr:uncharacterized protein PV10_02773 [Exophiala mesophila]KIV95074.1 hypothetical protein PV10_02773 [Exophiala mesophila]